MKNTLMTNSLRSSRPCRLGWWSLRALFALSVSFLLPFTGTVVPVSGYQTEIPADETGVSTQFEELHVIRSDRSSRLRPCGEAFQTLPRESVGRWIPPMYAFDGHRLSNGMCAPLLC